MRTLLLEIINKIKQQKVQANKVPVNAMKKEIVRELFLQMEIELELLCEDKKLSKGNTINDVYYQLLKKYYYLKKGELVQEGDEVEISNSFNDPPKWQKANCIGTEAPDPQYPAHRTYRRLISDEN